MKLTIYTVENIAKREDKIIGKYKNLSLYNSHSVKMKQLGYKENG